MFPGLSCTDHLFRLALRPDITIYGVAAVDDDVDAQVGRTVLIKNQDGQRHQCHAHDSVW